MKIHDFQNYINETILGRGYSYYIAGNIKEAYEQRNNEYIFHIEGSDDYVVVIEIGNNEDQALRQIVKSINEYAISL